MNFPAFLAYSQSLSLALIHFRSCVSILSQGLPSRTFVSAHRDSCVDSLSGLGALQALCNHMRPVHASVPSSELKQPLSAWDHEGSDHLKGLCCGFVRPSKRYINCKAK